MRWQDQLWWLQRTLIAQRRRSLLTVLGFAVGIAAVSLLSSLGEGVRTYIMKEFTQFGSHILAVTPGKTDTFGMSGTLNTVRPLSLQDAVALEQLAGVEQIVPVVFGSAQVKTVQRGRYTNIIGVGPDAYKAWQLSLSSGSFLPRDNWFYARPTTVLGSRLKQELFGSEQALGELVQIGGSRFRVVGVTAPKGQFLGVDMDDIAYIPTVRAQQLFNRESLMELDVFYRPGLEAGLMAERIRQRLIQRHGDEDFTIVTQDEMLKTMDNILQVLKAAAAGLGVISLLVGGVGVITILLITVNERTREIGLLCALGVTPAQIRWIFLSEAICLALLGGVAGLLVASAIIILLRWMMPGLPMVMDVPTVLMTLSLAAIVGGLAGARPAGKAASLKPIDALRAE